VHTWETYYYTGSLNHFIHAQDMKPPAMQLDLPYDRLLCLHYTQHPILYYFTYLICNNFFSLKDGLIIVLWFNILSGILACWVCYQICLVQTRSQLLAIIIMPMIAFSDVFWYQCLSGEVYIQPLLFLLLSFYFLIQSEMATENLQSINKKIIMATLAAAIAMAFHMFSGLFYVVILFFLIEMKRKNHHFRLLFMSGISVLIMVLFFISVYVIPYVAIFQLSSIRDWSQLIFLHTHHWGVWHVPFKFIFFETIWSFIIGTKHLLHAIVSGFSIFAIILRIFLLVIFSYTIWFHFFRNKEKSIAQKLLLLWFFIYFLFITINVPMVNDYWCFIIFPMIMFSLSGLTQCMKEKHLMYALMLVLCFIMSINFFDDIYPKSRIKKDDFFILSKAKKEINEAKEIIMIGNKHLLGEIWNLHQQCPDKQFYYHAPDVQFQSKKDFLESFNSLLHRLETKKALLILGGIARDAVRISSLFKHLNVLGARIFSISKKYQTNELKTAIGLNPQPVIITIYGFQISCL
jgi:hypothetical protein